MKKSELINFLNQRYNFSNQKNGIIVGLVHKVFVMRKLVKFLLA